MRTQTSGGDHHGSSYDEHGFTHREITYLGTFKSPLSNTKASTYFKAAMMFEGNKAMSFMVNIQSHVQYDNCMLAQTTFSEAHVHVLHVHVVG